MNDCNATLNCTTFYDEITKTQQNLTNKNVNNKYYINLITLNTKRSEREVKFIVHFINKILNINNTLTKSS